MKRLTSVVLLLLAAGCSKSSPGYEFVPDMAHTVPYDAFDPNPVTANGQTLQRPVAGTVARGALPFRYAATPEDAERAGRELQDPFAPTPEVLVRGEAVYRTFCWVCHGETGQGDGPIIPKFPNPPSYTSDRVRALPEGRIFHIITRGSGLMPAYATQISPEDRWKVVRYVERLRAATQEARK
ncbi:MAG TPA: c-type cytochrome [Thermoanaerobaculia bacterium]|nr:c-type cytochrome [Thermoanaerobaculia bacterium]